MKTTLRNLGLGIFMAGCIAVTAAPTFAQDVCKDVEPKLALDKEFRDNYDKVTDITKQETAVRAGKQYVEKYGACPDDKDFVDYLKSVLPTIEKGIEDTKKAGEAKKKAEMMKALFTRFDTAVKGTSGKLNAGETYKANASETYAVGKEVLAQNPEMIDVILVLGSVGFDQATLPTPVDTYNDTSIEYAKSAIQKLENGATSKTYGVWQYTYQNKEYPDGKSNALGWMNYNIGYITYYRQGKDNAAKKKEALPYLYKATQFKSSNKNNPFLYRTIGAWYLDEALKIDKERTAAIKTAGGKDTEETLAMFALSKGYADRSIDSYARAYKFAKDDKTQPKAFTDSLYTTLKELYQFRYDGKIEGIDAFVATVQNKPLPDPTTPITPVKEETPAATTTTTTGTTTTTAPATTVKPAAAVTPTKPVSATKPTATEVKTTATTTTKPAKPAPKKKGTR